MNMEPTIADAPCPRQLFLYDYGTTFVSGETRSFIINKLQASHSPKTAQIRKTTANLGKDGLGGEPGKLLELCERLEEAELISAKGQPEAAKAFGSLLAHGIATGCAYGGKAFVEANADQGGTLTLAWTERRMIAKQSDAVYRDPTKRKSQCVPSRSVEGEHPARRIMRCLERWGTSGRWMDTNGWGLRLAAWIAIIETMMAASRQMRRHPARLEQMARTGRIMLEPRPKSTTNAEASIDATTVAICFRSTGTPVLLQRTRPYGRGVDTVRLNWNIKHGLLVLSSFRK